MTIIIAAAIVASAIVVFFSLWANAARRHAEGEVDDQFIPTVTVVTPMFNEGIGIRRTVESLLNQTYPKHKLNLIIVDDCSTDDSYECAKAIARREPRVQVIRNPVNMGKRRSINRAVERSTSEIIVSVDSDVIVDADAVRQLIRRFTKPSIAAVGGRVDILNKRENWLTKMQAVKYYYGYHSLKNMERAFRRVMCLSGCLTAYRRDVLVELAPLLENRNVMGVTIKYGEDRFLTRQIIKAGYETTMTCDAVCGTKAPTGLMAYFSQQLRWRRSNFIDYFGSFSHARKMHPVVALCYYSVFVLFVTYPALLVNALVQNTFWNFMAYHVVAVLAFGVFHQVRTRGKEKSNIFDFLPMVITLPVTYGLLPVLAVLSLDAKSWETRGHTEELANQDNNDVIPNAAVPVPVHAVSRSGKHRAAQAAARVLSAGTIHLE